MIQHDETQRTTCLTKLLCKICCSFNFVAHKTRFIFGTSRLGGFRGTNTSSRAILYDDVQDLLKKVITGDESWVSGYDIETKAQSFQWKHPEVPRPKKARQVRQM